MYKRTLQMIGALSPDVEPSEQMKGLLTRYSNWPAEKLFEEPIEIKEVMFFVFSSDVAISTFNNDVSLNWTRRSERPSSTKY